MYGVWLVGNEVIYFFKTKNVENNVGYGKDDSIEKVYFNFVSFICILVFAGQI